MENNFEKLLKKYSNEKLQEIILDKEGYVEDFRIAASIELKRRDSDFDSDAYKNELEQSRKESIASYSSTNESNHEKYPTLSGISVVIKILAWVTILASFIVLGVIASKDIKLGFPTILAILFYAVVSFILLYAISEIIKLFIDIEKNTRTNKNKTSD